MRRNNIFSKLQIVSICLIFLILCPVIALPQENYRFERMWPVLKQPWYFVYLYGIAVDARGYVYVADTFSHRIHKFTRDGFLSTRWGKYGTENGEFDRPAGIAIDSNRDIYVTDFGNHRIQKFTQGGNFVKAWGTEGNSEGLFKYPTGIAIDKNDDVYVVDSLNHRIQKFDSHGIFIMTWGHKGYGEGEFNEPYDIITDTEEYVYVTDKENHRVQKFDSYGNFISEWGEYGNENGKFNSPLGITVDGNNYIYVTEELNSRIQKFNNKGVHIETWTSPENGDYAFIKPFGLATDNNNFVYVTDTQKPHILIFTSDGIFKDKWGAEAADNGMFELPGGLAMDSDNKLYVADVRNHRIQKFKSDGTLLDTWGSHEQFNEPSDIAIDSNGNIYVADSLNHCIQKLSKDGVELVSQSIYKFTSDGELITKFGKPGSSPGELSYPAGVCVSSEGKVYVSDTGNNRIQVFKQGLPTDKIMKAVIVAGSREGDDALWDSTQMNANFAYRALTYQGFTKESIHYLSLNTELDLDENGEPDDVDGEPTIENLRNAITNWASDAQSLVVYLIDHGGTGIFSMGDQKLLKFDLYPWLDEFQNNETKELILVYDACYSGSFLPDSTDERNRIIITSASEDEYANFINQGLISFSCYFWSSIFNGLNIQESFEMAEKGIKGYLEEAPEQQNPQIHDPGNISSSTFIGIGAEVQGDAPLITNVSGLIEGSSATLQADVIDTDGVSRVWAVIRPPDYHVPDILGAKSVLELPTAELTEKNGHYEGTYDAFSKEGTYQIAIYARDRAGKTLLFI
ncbi:MAG: hypothetical protein GY749_10580 [Desulfobacteraceae bacterium]|nr:hypothetical protein [Desulfobacteraceae bacterium]